MCIQSDSIEIQYSIIHGVQNSIIGPTKLPSACSILQETPYSTPLLLLCWSGLGRLLLEAYGSFNGTAIWAKTACSDGFDLQAFSGSDSASSGGKENINGLARRLSSNFQP